jgi:hypothetical protein
VIDSDPWIDGAKRMFTTPRRVPRTVVLFVVYYGRDFVRPDFETIAIPKWPFFAVCHCEGIDDGAVGAGVTNKVAAIHEPYFGVPARNDPAAIR